MSASTTRKKSSKIDQLMEQASEALNKRDYFTSERLSQEALELAHQAHDFDSMARILMPLQESRRQKRLVAIDTGKLIRLSEEMPEEIQPACYLIEPNLVGANGRDLRDRANVEQVPVVVVVREPKTQLGKWPIVMIGPITVRTYVDPPKNDKPTIDWMIMAGEALGDEAIGQVDTELEPGVRVAQLLDRLGTVVDHELLHQELESACKAAARAQAQSAHDKR